ncbi:MAG: DDE-type integrase/transposase/recombinase [Chloroflexota bacterium]|nr:DDE-type integrase/transposase/recombinase [Chloroflexota bacterium]
MGDEKQETRFSERATQIAELVRPLQNMHPIADDVMETVRIEGGKILNKERVSVATVYNWIRLYKQGGIADLEHKEHRDSGESTLHPDLRQYIEDLLQSDKKYTLAEIHRRAEKKAEKMELSEEVFPTYDQVRFIDKKLSEAAKHYGREGPRAYRAEHELTGRFEAEYPNDIWQGDHHLLDILLINEETGKPDRPWITAFIDDHSRAIMGFHLSFSHPNSNSIALAFHHAMCPKPEELWVMHGIPRMIYIDNGKDFRSRHIQEVCTHFNIERRSHERYLARSKGKIERWFRTLEEMLIAYLDGYVGNDVKKRPESVRAKLTLGQLRDIIVEFIIKTYHERIHRSTKAKPRVRWLETPKVLRVVNQLEELDYLLESKSSIVQKDGIPFNSGKYLDKEGILTPYRGKPVRFFYNRNDISSVRVYYRDGNKEKFLCTAYRNLPAQMIAEQNKIVRSLLQTENLASRRRLQQDSKDDRDLSTKTNLSDRHNEESQPIVRNRIRRYRFEFEEPENDE